MGKTTTSEETGNHLEETPPQLRNEDPVFSELEYIQQGKNKTKTKNYPLTLRRNTPPRCTLPHLLPPSPPPRRTHPRIPPCALPLPPPLPFPSPSPSNPSRFDPRSNPHPDPLRLRGLPLEATAATDPHAAQPTSPRGSSTAEERSGPLDLRRANSST